MRLLKIMNIPVDKTKKELEDYLNNKRVPLMISLVYTKIPKEKLIESLQKSTLTINKDKVDFSSLANSLSKDNLYETIIQHMINLALKNAVTDYYESIMKYCKQTKQTDILKKQPWYNYSKLIRNGLSHDYQWDFSKQTKSIFPVTYKQTMITYDLHGTLLKENQMPLSVIWVLLKEMENFVKTHLK